MTVRRHPATRLAMALRHVLGGEAGGGLVLIAVAVAAMVAANSGWAGTYRALFDAPMRWTPVARLPDLHGWIDEGAMSLFFFVVGLEIKREVLAGDLSSPARRRLPLLAAVAGMAMPAAIYLLIVGHVPALARGWAAPVATDIAFALGVLALVGRRAPRSLRLFLLTVAIVDDLGAVAIIALGYTARVDPAWLAAAAGVLAGMFALGRLSLANGLPHASAAVLLWLCVLHSGVHATVAGVLAAFAVPLALDRHGHSMLLRFERVLVPLTSYLVVPLFGFANAGVSLAAIGGAEVLTQRLPLAVAAGLLFGKQAGVFGAIAIAERTGIAPRPAGASWLQIWGIAALCGIGFTMSLFIGGLAFGGRPDLHDQAKLGVLAGSLASAVLGCGLLWLAGCARR